MLAMEDTVSVKSSESVATSDEFDFITDKSEDIRTPTLAITHGDLTELQNALKEVLQEPECVHATTMMDNGEMKRVGQSMFYIEAPTMAVDVANNAMAACSPTEKHDEMKPDYCSDEEFSDVDQDCTIFSGVTYLGAAAINAPKSETEIQRNMAILNEQQSSEQGIKIAVSVPSSSQGVVVLYDASSNSVIARYEIHRILFYARGAVESNEAGCFAFTWSHGDTQESAIFQCHVFRCDIAEAVSRVSTCFAKAFQRVPRSMSNSVTSTVAEMSSSITTLPENRTLMYVFEVNLEVREDDGKGTFSAVPKDRSGFKLRVNLEKQLCLTIQQVSDNGPQLCIERCFGILVSPGRGVRHSDMQLLEMINFGSEFVKWHPKIMDIQGIVIYLPSAGTGILQASVFAARTVVRAALNEPGKCLHARGCNSGYGNLKAWNKKHGQKNPSFFRPKVQTGGGASIESNSTSIVATWDPTEPAFESLNTETKDSSTFMTVAVDLVIRGIQEPVRFQIETAIRVYGQHERFWSFQRRSLVQQFFLNLKETTNGDLLGDIVYEVLNMETSGELDRNRLNLTLNLSSLIQSPSITSVESITPKEEYHSDGDEPLLSGTGSVSKDCADDVLENWADVLHRWKSTKQRPKQLPGLVRLGIPEALRGEVWQRLAGTEENLQVMDTYRLLIAKDCSCENVIQRDIARTFPAHDFFKEAGGLGQDSLYRVSKAYAVYDSEVGYCQGLSFLAATLLLHMPEEQAFCVLVKLMYDYGLRNLYKDGFDNLYLRLYQLNRLIEEQLPQLWQRLTEHHVETHMFASQWFLTLFTARFPLFFVFHVLDIFLLQGIDTLFQVSVALLMLCKKDLLQLDFEGMLKYFRVSLPKKCRSEDAARHILKLACSIKVKKLKKYEAEFTALKEAADSAEHESTELEQLRVTVTRLEEERRLLFDENAQLKEMLKREVGKAEAADEKNTVTVNEYKLIRHRLETQVLAVKAELEVLKEKIASCEKCCLLINEDETTNTTTDDASNNPKLAIDNETRALNRIRELELELAQTKLAQVEAECRNQDLTHQLRATEVELSTTKNNWPPWISKTLSSIKEVANNKKELGHFPYSHSSMPTSTASFVSHINLSRRDSAPLKPAQDVEKEVHLIKDSQSCSSLKSGQD